MIRSLFLLVLLSTAVWAEPPRTAPEWTKTALESTTTLAYPLDVLAQEARTLSVRLAFKPGRNLQPELESALKKAASEAPTLNDQHAHLLAALLIALLEDHRALSDSSHMDGPRWEVRNESVKVLEVLAGRKLGALDHPGGMRPESIEQKLAKEDRECVAAWKKWWTAAAPKPRSQWSKI